MISACLVPSKPAPPVIRATRPLRLNRSARVEDIRMLYFPGLPSVGDEARPGDERSARRTKENDEACNLVRSAKAVHRHLSSNTSEYVFAILLEPMLPSAAREEN